MDIKELLDLYGLHPTVGAAHNWLKKSRVSQHLLLRGLTGSSRAVVLAALFAKSRRPQLIIAEDAEQAAYLENDILTLLSADEVALFPSLYRRKQRRQTDSANQIQRTDTLNRMANSGQAMIVVTSPEAMVEPVVSAKSLQQNTLKIIKGENYAIDQLTAQLVQWNFSPVDFVYEPGQFSVRGGIVDIFSYAYEYPYRIDFFGDEVDSIRVFDIESQLSQRKLDAVEIVPNMQVAMPESRETLLDYLKDNSLLVSPDFSLVSNRMQMLAGEDDSLMDIDLRRQVATTIELAQRSAFSDYSQIDFHTQPQIVFHKNFDLLAESLQQSASEGYHIYILSDSKKQTDRLAAIFEDKQIPVAFTPVDHTLHEGFVDQDQKICCYTDHQIFERFHKVEQKTDRARQGKILMTLKEINQLQVGDYVVHLDFGIGKFGGLVRSSINGGKPQEMVKLIYRDNDLVFVNLHGLHRISKYKGKDGTPPAVSKLGSGQWERVKERTKTKVKDIARDLIQLYAARKAEQGYRFAPDNYLQRELEASFIYEDTPDQQKATLDLKHDMESPVPMDRLICGDVGFGKTEIAMRAAFKAVCDGKQVAVLVPTTVLALQHYNSFVERYKNFPVTVEYLSRARSAKQEKEILDQLQQGQIDILIGTHKLVGKNVHFKDLGLLIIDEEQKFGVAVKEKLKQLKVNVDTLTLTATPIPRTLQFSLMGARDLSVMTTPPPNRYPVQTEIITPDDEYIIRDAIESEMSRNGQVFVIHNRIQNIGVVANKIRRLVPQARIVIAHGQMPPAQMEEILVDFINYEYDVLIATSIIENGVDIPNVNTILINNAQQFGLSDLHQMRGRVGRSNKKAYCYLIAPDMATLSTDARRRLQAVETFADLGSGFNLAMQDLDIRGAGNLLGAEQSGFIADLGYEAYQKILNEAVLELREDEFSDLFANAKENFANTRDNNLYVADCQLDADLEISFPETYVENVSERIVLYRELDSLQDERALLEYKKRLIDRFGPIPPQAEELITVVQMRWAAMRLGVEKIALKQNKMVLYLVSNPQSYYYQSDVFGKLIQYAVAHPRRCQLRDINQRRSLLILNVKSVMEANSIIAQIENSENQ